PERAGELAEPVGDGFVPRRDALGHRGLVRGDATTGRLGAHPEPHELGDLLGERHVLNEVLDPIFGWERGVTPRLRGGGLIVVVVHWPSLRARLRVRSQLSIGSRNLSDTRTVGRATGSHNLLPVFAHSDCNS